MKTFLFIFLCLFLTACPGDKGDDKPEETPPVVIEPAPTDPTVPDGPDGEPPVIEPAPQPEPVPTPPAPVPPTSEVPPDRASTFKVNITYGGTANTATRRAKYEKAIALVKKIIASKEFKDRVLAHEYDGSPGFASSSASPAEVYEHILDGNEKLQNTKDNEMDMEVRFYYANNSTVGYTYPNVKYIYVNTKFFDGYKLSSVCANMVHEWLHKLGYGHDAARTTRRPYSVPYGVGNITRIVGDKLL